MSEDEDRARLTAAVADLFPLKSEETADEYIARAFVELPEHLRPELLARLRDSSLRERVARQARKDAWITRAREDFRPGDRAPCQVCGKFRSLSQAHHIVPLAWQFDRGVSQPDQDHVWLCPTHHIALHVLLGNSAFGLEANDDKKLRAHGTKGAAIIVDLSLEEIAVVLDLLAMSAWGRE